MREFRQSLQSLVLAAFAVAGLWASSLAAAEPREAKFTTKGGTEMTYFTQGDSGSWVVLIPGLSDNPKRMYIDSGIAAALAKNHRVVATPDPGKLASPEDVVELIDNLKIDKAHFYGYSMGGGFTGTLLAKHPERFITAAFGGSGIWEYEQEQHDRANAIDQAILEKAGRSGRGGAPGARGGGRGIPRGGRDGGGGRRGGGGESAAPATTDGGKPWPPVPVSAARPHSRTPIDLATVTIPVLAINGSLDQPFAKSQRMFRELIDFNNVILPGHDHMSAIGVNGQFPKQHIDALVRFIEANDK